MNNNLRKSVRRTISGLRNVMAGMVEYNTTELSTCNVDDVSSKLSREEREEFTALIAECITWKNKIGDHYMMEACSLSGLESHFYGSPQYDAVACSTDYLDSARSCIVTDGSIGDLITSIKDAIDYMIAAIE